MANEPIHHPDNFFRLPPVERQYILVGEQPNTALWKWLITPTTIWEGVKIIVRQGAPGFVPVTSQVAQELSFPEGSPQQGTVYRAHPQEPMEYLSVASFHPRILRDKFEEALAITISLGATSVEAEFHSGTKLHFSPVVSLPQAPNVPVDVEATGSTNHDYRFDATLRPGQPSLPKSSRWLRTEPSWQALVDAALQGRVDEYTLGVELRNDFGLRFKAAQQLKAAGVSIGGNFQAFRETSYSLKAVFS